jgi:hypothetical protein
MIERLPRLSDTRSLRVIPAKRGEAGFSRTHLTCVRAAERVQRVSLHPGQQQALNGSRALRATQKHICGSRTAGEVLFFARAKKSTQKKHAPDGATTPCASRRSRRAPQLAGRACTRGAPIRGAPVRRHGSPPDFPEYSASPSGSNTRRARTPGPAAMLGAPYGEVSYPPHRLLGSLSRRGFQ